MYVRQSLLLHGWAGGAACLQCEMSGSISSNAELRHDWVRTLLPSP